MNIALSGIAWDHPRGYDSVAGASAVWCAEHPEVAIRWSRRSLQAFADAPLAELVRQYDLLVIDHPHVPEAAAEGLLLPLDGRGHESALERLAAESVGPSHGTYAHMGHQWALAIDAAAQVAVYRPDLLAVPPRTWDEVWELAATGRMLWPAKPIDALSSFLTLAANRGTPCANGPDRLIEPEAGVEVLQHLHRMADAVPSFCLEANPIEVAERLVAADHWAYAPLAFGYVNYARAGFRPHRLAYVDMPGGALGPVGSCLGGAGIAVSATTRFPEEAVAVALWLASADTQRGVYYRSGGQPANRTAWQDPALNADTLGFFAGTLATLDLAWVRPRTRAWLRIQDEAGAVVNRALHHLIGDTAAIAELNALYARQMAGDQTPAP